MIISHQLSAISYQLFRQRLLSALSFRRLTIRTHTIIAQQSAIYKNSKMAYSSQLIAHLSPLSYLIAKKKINIVI